MNFCSSCDIAFIARKCPLCEAERLIADLQAQVERQQASIDEMLKDEEKV